MGKPSKAPLGWAFQIRSGVLRDALAAGDELVSEVMHRTAEVLGQACLTVRHLIDPQLVLRPLVSPVVERPIYIVLKRGRSLSPASRAMCRAFCS